MSVLDLDDLPTIRRRRPDEIGGEWDYLRGLPPKVRRRLVGAGLLGTSLGVAPDQLTEEINHRLGADLQTCDAVALWCREALRTIEERQREARRRRERQRAREAGFRSWWEYRTALYRDRGASSVHAYAIAQGWRS